MHTRIALPTVLLATLALQLLTLTSCVGDPGDYGRKDKSIPIEYSGLDKKSVAIVVYADDATTWEYARARDEVSSFVSQSLRASLPAARILDYKEVLQWQDETLNWYALPVKDIGKHFGVDRVIYIEVLQYGSRENGSADLLRGHVKANCNVYEIDSGGADKPAWSKPVEKMFPEDGPEDPMKSNDLIVRKRALEGFASDLVAHFAKPEKDKS